MEWLVVKCASSKKMVASGTDSYIQTNIELVDKTPFLLLPKGKVTLK